MISTVWAQDGAAALAPAGDINSMLMSALPFVLVFAIFYFVMIRPQMQATKKHAALLTELKKGDVVVTDGGLIGEVSSVLATMVHVRVADGMVLTVAKEAVRNVLQGDAAKGWEARGKVADAIVKKSK